MTLASKTRINMAFAALAGLVLRVIFVLKYPVTDSGDAPIYIELAWNWLKKGVYGFPVHGQLTPVDMRVPGYPAFLGAVFAFAGKSTQAAMFAQAAVDLGTCFVIALIAARLAPATSRRRVALAALWLAALCPFTANYSAVILTEALITFLTALTILILLGTEVGVPGDTTAASAAASRRLNQWFLAGIVAGIGTLVRPETPLVLFAAGLVLIAKWWQPVDWSKALRAGTLMAVGLVIPLMPWAARNWRTLHTVQFLAPRYSELPGEYTPLGFNAWTNTWLWRFRDVYATQWKLDVEEISMDDIPASAFDSPSERTRVEGLLEQHNEKLTLEPEADNQFRAIARDRTARHPLRTYLKIPLLRSFALWFTPRVELLPLGGHLWPVREEWEDDRPDFVSTLGLALINILYIALALGGAWLARHRPGLAFLLVFLVVRTAFFVYFVETPEPRYVLECFPVVIALAAQIFSVRRSAHLSSKGSG